MSLQSKLQHIGLTEKEARIYLASLELGAAFITDIANKAEINRTTAYLLMDSLKQKGLITTSLRKKKKYYLAAEPRDLQKIIESKDKLLQDIMPALLNLSNINNKKPKVIYYEGKDGLINLYLKSLEARTELLFFDNEKHWVDFVLKYIPEYSKIRTKKAVRSKVITHDTPISRKLKERDKFELRKMKLINSKKYFFKISFAVFNNTVIILSPDELIGLSIESKDIAQTMKSFFNLAWDGIPEN